MSSSSQHQQSDQEKLTQNLKKNKKLIKSQKLQQKQQELQESKNQNNQEHKIQQKQQKQQNKQQTQMTAEDLIVCFLCQDILVSTVQAYCGHEFCQYCISQYFLVCQDCPICGQKIREKRLPMNKRIDQFIQEFFKFIGQEQLQNYKQRKQQHKRIKNQRKLEEVISGALVDVRDDEYIWRKGRVMRTFNRINSQQVRVKFAIVQYLDTGKKQQFPATCTRLAKPNIYTSRDDIPKYQDYLILTSAKCLTINLEQMENNTVNQNNLNQYQFQQERIPECSKRKIQKRQLIQSNQHIIEKQKCKQKNIKEKQEQMQKV